MYEWREHTSEIELSVEATDAESVFAEALEATGEMLGESAGEGGEPAAHEVAIEARDLPALLVEWLGELIVLAETDAFVPERIERLELEQTRLRAQVAGRRALPQSQVKAVTYHRLQMAEREEGGWQARVVFDV